MAPAHQEVRHTRRSVTRGERDMKRRSDTSELEACRMKKETTQGRKSDEEGTQTKGRALHE